MRLIKIPKYNHVINSRYIKEINVKRCNIAISMHCHRRGSYKLLFDYKDKDLAQFALDALVRDANNKK